ncbi:ATP-binding cassette domain-containing protein [Fluviispira multicolorata]|uniref:ATP-binding cassette domain-containing protein n=1 Tax=Fluviispira multicolorata TaxID=2654512 RepID=A0A833N357_9BACT|nr:ABC transporter ATP-binding protein [Fluviispira multicolorata]KAB8027779.1 ATP-binding cassette domain-containing protein [Fluviispira multicolorata]
MTLKTKNDNSSFKLWIQQIKLWPSQFSIIIISIIIMIPLSLCLLIIIPYIIQAINSSPADVTWQKLLGEQLSLWIFPVVEGTPFESSIPISFQKNWFALILVTVSGIYGFFNYYSDYLLRDLGEKLAHKLRSDIIKKYLSFSYQAANSVDVGLLASMVGEDMREVQQTFTRLISSLLKDGVTSLIFLCWLIILDTQLFILFLTVLIPAGIVLRITSKTLKKLSRQGLQFESELLSGILERMRGWQTIQVHKAIDFEIKNFNKINNKIYHVWRRATRAKALGSPLVEWFGIIAGAFIIIAALRRISDGALASNILTSFMVTVAFLSDKINRMTSQLNSTRKGTDALHRVNNFLLSDFEKRVYTNSNIDERKNGKVKSIELNNISIGNDENNILLENFNMKLNSGTLLAIVGPSGIGKSTFIRTILGIQASLKGSLLINGEAASEAVFQRYANDICFIPQDPFIFSGSIFENVTYPLRIDQPTVEDLEKAKTALSLSLLDKNLDDKIEGLSGGEKQRLMFARIFFKNPSFIVIDEGTSAIDIGNELKIIENLKNHVSESITFVVAHRPAIRKYATEILDFSKTKPSHLLT